MFQLPTNTTEIPARLKELRKIYLSLTKAEMATRLGTTESVIAGMEDGSTQLSAVLAYDIHGAFNVNTSWLLTGVGTVFIEGAI